MGSRTGFGDSRHIAVAEPARRGVLREYAETILICVLFLLFARTFVFQQSEIPSGSMEDTILVGDYVLVNRFLYAPTGAAWESSLLPIRAVRRGDVLVFRHPNSPELEYIKRVIGLPGDVVLVDGGRVWINDQPLDEPYVGLLYRAPEPDGRPFGPLTIEPEHYFVLGDHRNDSADSRRWGLVHHDLIKGRAMLILFSTSAPPPPGTAPGQVSIGSLFRKLLNLAFHARWDRALRAIE